MEHVGQLGLGSMVVAGGVAGVCYWLPVYPADIVKSRIQVDDYNNPAYRSTWDCAKQVRTHHAMHHMPCVKLPTTAAVYTVLDQTTMR